MFRKPSSTDPTSILRLRRAGPDELAPDALDQLERAFAAFGACELVVEQPYGYVVYEKESCAMAAKLQHDSGAQLVDGMELDVRYAQRRRHQVRARAVRRRGAAPAVAQSRDIAVSRLSNSIGAAG